MDWCFALIFLEATLIRIITRTSLETMTPTPGSNTPTLGRIGRDIEGQAQARSAGLIYQTRTEARSFLSVKVFTVMLLLAREMDHLSSVRYIYADRSLVQYL